MSKIASAIIYLDDNVPEYMVGLVRVGSVELFDLNGQLINDDDKINKLINNTEYQKAEIEKLISDVAMSLEIDIDNVTVE